MSLARICRLLAWLIGVSLCLGFSLLPLLAQDFTCPALVDQALLTLGDNCSGLNRNSACYGYNRVDATFAQQTAQDFFSQPADKTDLVALKTIQTTPLDLAQQEWGIAVMNVQANVPDALPGQAVTFLLLGDTEVENAVEPVAAASGPATAITQTDADLLVEPRADAPVIARVPAGAVLQLESVSEDQAWLRVATSIGAGWITRAAVNPTPAVNNLPIEGQARLSPMQAFYFRTGLGGPTCQETPSVLAIKSPENITVDLTANGANIRLGSLVVLQVLPPGDTMRLTTLEGMAVLNPDTPEQVNLPARFSTTRCLTTPESLGIDGESNDQEVGENCAWEPPAPTLPQLLTESEIVQAAFIQLGLGSSPTIAPLTPPLVECPVGTNITHVVSPGENLYRIGLRYRTGMGAIMAANGLTNPGLIFAGQPLTIPCGVDTGLPSLPSFPPPTVPPPGVPPIVGADCAGFRATSPLDGFPYGTTTFYWDPAPGATSYQVNIYSVDETPGALVGSFTTGGGSTSLSADVTVGSIGYGFSFAWEVLALVNGQVACASQRYTIPRAPQSPGGSAFAASWTCAGPATYTLIINYSSLPPGTTSVTISFSNSFTGGPTGGTFAASGSGSQSFYIVTSATGGTVIANPSEIGVSLPGSPNCT